MVAIVPPVPPAEARKDRSGPNMSPRIVDHNQNDLSPSRDEPEKQYGSADSRQTALFSCRRVANRLWLCKPPAKFCSGVSSRKPAGPRVKWGNSNVYRASYRGLRTADFVHQYVFDDDRYGLVGQRAPATKVHGACIRPSTPGSNTGCNI
jgi:hypothetical protein